MVKLLSEVQLELEKQYSGITKDMDGFTYIPWNESVDLANKVFGYFGWSSEVLTCDYVETSVDVPNKDRTEWVPKEFKGFKSIVRVGVQVRDDASGEIIRTHHDGVGFGEIRAMGNKNPMDNACKSAKSDGVSTAIKHFGDAFGLYLYKKETGSSTSTSNGYVQSNHTGTSNSKPLSEGQITHLKKNFVSLGLDISKVDYQTGKGLLDAIWNKNPEQKLSPEKAMEKFNIPVVKKGDGLPIPV